MASGNNKDKKTVDAAMASKPSDRRIKERFPATCLNVQLSERGFFGRGKNPVAVNCLDMNRYGMAVQYFNRSNPAPACTCKSAANI